MTRATTDIIIAGGGVAGLTAAAALGSAGHRVTIVDPASPITDEATAGADLRTTAILQPARALMQQAGLWERLAPFATPLQIMRIVEAGADEPVTRDFDASDVGSEPFGWNLPNWLLRREMVARLAELPTVDFRPGTGFASALARTASVLVRLSDGSQLESKLLIGADGRNSQVRQFAEISVTTKRYGQKALTFAVTHDAPHDNVSTEIHRAGGPFTLVPLPDHNGQPCSSVVWMEDGPKVQALADLSDTAFATAATERSAGLYGSLTLVGRRSVWPIISQLATAITAPRTALMAEAAHVLPPIGAQGLNMSLADLACLRDLIAETDDPGAPALLDRYAAAPTPTSNCGLRALMH